MLTTRRTVGRRRPTHAAVAQAPLNVAVAFLRGTFAPTDRLAVVLVHRPTGAVTQRLATAATLTSARWQAWLRAMNAQHHDVFVSINALAAGARHRTKRDIACVRHLLLDVDGEADVTLARLHDERCLPPPHHVVRSSSGRCQVLWRVTGLAPTTAEQHQRRIALHYGGDLAATDSARVGRWPGFRNHKYPTRPFATVTTRAIMIWDAETFEALASWSDGRTGRTDSEARATQAAAPRRTGGSQSERDWQWTLQQLAAGVAIDHLERALALRRRDKHQPADYAARTVDAAWVTLALRAGRTPDTLMAELCARRYARPSPSAYATAIVERAVIRTAATNRELR